MNLKNILFLIIGLLIAYPLYYYVAHNNGLLSKIPFGIVAFCSFYFFLSSVTSRFSNSSFYDFISKLTFILSAALAFLTYDMYDRITFGSREEQNALLEKSKSIAIGKVIEIEHFDSFIIRRKTVPERWEIKYEFKDEANKSFKSFYSVNEQPTKQVGDTLLIKYIKDNPEINKQISK